MIDETLNTLERRIENATGLAGETRASLQALVADLRREVDKLEDADQAESIAAHTDTGAREALRAEPDADLFSHAMDGMQKSVRRFEASHPELTGIVNGICQHLSNLGI